jgi:hypothetical protein
VKVAGVSRETEAELTAAVAVHTVAAPAEGETAGRTNPKEATTVARATARTREAGSIILTSDDRRRDLTGS